LSAGKDTRRQLPRRIVPGYDALTIKRGCSEFEAAVGPSDRYQFTPEMAELEAYLKSRFRERKADHHPSVVVANWINRSSTRGRYQSRPNWWYSVAGKNLDLRSGVGVGVSQRRIVARVATTESTFKALKYNV